VSLVRPAFASLVLEANGASRFAATDFVRPDFASLVLEANGASRFAATDFVRPDFASLVLEATACRASRRRISSGRTSLRSSSRRRRVALRGDGFRPAGLRFARPLDDVTYVM
jgi:hypothetical protein